MDLVTAPTPFLWRVTSLLGTLCILGAGTMVNFQAVSAAPLGSCAPIVAIDGLYSVASFTTTGACNWTVPGGVASVTYLVVGGGGGGASGGGGGGGVITNHGVSTLAMTPNAVMSVVVGAGGLNGGGGGDGAGVVSSTSGGNSTFGTITATGGGYGGTRTRDPADGGSGGGGGWDVPSQRISLGVAGQGNSGGRSNRTSYGASGGGGGAGGVGANAPEIHRGGAGGIGVSTLITGTSTWFGGGGGGGLNNNCNCTYANGGGLGGSGVGGNGSSQGYDWNHPTGIFFDGTAGLANTGGGGGGTDPEANLAGNGGSGIVIVRYLTPASAPANSAIPTISGTARTGETLTASSPSSSWTGSPTSYSFQWSRSLTSDSGFIDIGVPTGNTYVVSEFDVRYFIKVSVIATNSVGSSSAALSDPTTVVVDIAPTNTVIPAITGTARTGATLTTSNGSWTSAPTASTAYTYQWKRADAANGTYNNITSARDRTYDLTDADIDKFIKVSVIATNSIEASSAALSAATSVVVDLTDSVVPITTSPVSTANGFTFKISNFSNSYNYAVTATKGTVSRTTDDVTVTGLTAGESATVTITVTRSLYKSASKTVAGSAIPPATTTTAAPALSIVIQAPVTTVAQGQVSVATLAPTTTTLPVLAANGVPVPTTTTTAPTRARTVVTTTLPRIVTTTTVGPPVIDKVDAGQSAVQVDGVKTAAVVTRSNNQMVVTAGSLSATLSGLDKTGKRAALDSNGVVHLAVGDVIKISLGGFKPKSLVEVWLFSTPTKLGTAEVGADGKMSGEYKLPFGTKSGSHRVVVTAKLLNGKPTTFTLGILVGDISTTSTLTRVLIAIPISLAIGFGFLLPTRLRRRRKALPA